jgi:serine/threonine protein kinase
VGWARGTGRDERLDRDVAIKVLPSSVAQDPERIARFEREAKAVAKLDHPNILAIHDFGTDEDVTYSVTELLAGETLRERLEGGALSWRKAAEIEGCHVHTSTLIGKRFGMKATVEPADH